MKKIVITKNEQISKMLKLMASKNYSEALAAREAFAAFIQKPIVEVIQAGAVIGSLYSTLTYDYNSPATIPLDAFYDIRQADLFHVWSQSRPGGLATHQLFNVDELPVSTAAFESAVSLPLNYVRSARIDVVARYLNRLAQEFLIKQEANSFAVLAAPAAQSTYLNTAGATNYQVIRANTQGALYPQDLNKLDTLMSRVNTPGVGGTPAGATRAITTLLVSPEVIELIKNMAFEPLNIRLGSSYPLGGPDKMRDEMYNAPATTSFMGRELVNVYDLGVGQRYNIVFGAYAGSTAYAGYGGSGTAAFSPGSEQVIIGIDRNQEFLVRLVETNPDDGSELNFMADNQWSVRSETVGFFAKLREGRVALDGRSVVSLVL